ncbi:hypothetical protein INR49_022382 [Caranx melampygus]|nr:hypothetical protein INR49_022382 [Caranx melampygus]
MVQGRWSVIKPGVTTVKVLCDRHSSENWIQLLQKMEDSPHLYFSEFGGNKDIEEEDEEEEENIFQEETNMEPDTIKSPNPDLHKHPNQDTERVWDSFPCQYCERHFTSKQGLERHMHIHATTNNEAHAYKSNKSNTSSGSNVGQLQHEQMKPLDSAGPVMQIHTSSPSSSTLSVEDHIQEVIDGHHACKYCEKIFTTHTNKRRHERRIHEQHLQLTSEEKTQLPQEESLQGIVTETSQQETQLGDNPAPAAALENEGEHTEQYMLDVSSNISENLSFYIDGKIVSTSTNTESTVVQKERTVFLSPKLKQLLEKQDGLKPTLALITDGQKPCSPVSLSVLPTGTGRISNSVHHHISGI